MAAYNFKTPLFIASFLLIILTTNACKNENQAIGTDQELYEMAQTTQGFRWYKNSTSLLSKSSGSGHSNPFLRTRYNAIAASKLDSTGKIQTGATFPEGALIVKELYDNSTSLGRYAMLYKKSTHSDADALGWVWGYINSDGSVAESASKKGSACISCHSQTDNIDYMLMNAYFP
jgi:hypothetical protein